MEKSPDKKRKKVLPFILGLVILAAIAFGVQKYMYSKHHEDTDDAQIDGDINPVMARVGGYVHSIRFEENNHVKFGDTLVILDNREFYIHLRQAEAGLENSGANVSVSKANVSTAIANLETAKSNVESARIRVWRATQDFNRYQNLLKENAATQQQFDASKAEKETAENQLIVLQKQESAASLQVETAQQQVKVAQSSVALKQSDVDYANLQLSYSAILAPVSGIVSRKNIQPGQLVNPGTPLCAIVSDSALYVTANFKETQLEKMQLGQSVQIEPDAFPGVKLNGIVDHFSAATGAKFSLLPPDNATGNFVKVVQRIPVKILMKSDVATLSKLRPGMSVKVSVLVSE